MKKELQMLNDVVIDLKEFENYKLNDMEKKRMKDNIKKKINKNKKEKKFKMATSAAMIILCVLGVGFIFGDDVLAGINNLGSQIEQYFKVKDSYFEDYKTVVNKSITKNGLTVKLNEVLLDDAQMLISSSFNSNEVDVNKINPFPSIYINGNPIYNGLCSTLKEEENSTVTYFSTVDLSGIDLSENMKMKIEYKDIEYGNKSKIKGKWKFEFSANRDNLLPKVKTIDIDKKINLNEGQKITIKNLTLTPVSTTINYTMENGYKHDMLFIVKDQNGNEIKSLTGHTMVKDCHFRYGFLDDSVEKLIITPFIISGREGKNKTDFKKVLTEETFEVKIK